MEGVIFAFATILKTSWTIVLSFEIILSQAMDLFRTQAVGFERKCGAVGFVIESSQS